MNYELTFTVNLEAPDTMSEADVKTALQSYARLSEPAVIGNDMTIKDVYTTIIALSAMSGDGYDKYNDLVDFLARENAHSKYVNERLRKMSEEMGMTAEDYKEPAKPKKEPKVTLKDIATVWQKCTVSDSVLKLPTEQLDRKVYDEVKKQLEACGGKWKGGKVQGFEFSETTDVNDVLANLQTGKDYSQEKKEYQFFATPDEVADRVAAEFGKIKDGAKFLEPSAGRGALIKAVKRLNNTVTFDAYEAMEDNKKVLKSM